MTTNGQAICIRALKLIGAITPGDEIDADEVTDAYDTLQEMMDGWATDRLTIFEVQRSVFPLNALQQNYTLGPGGDFDRQRPEWLDRFTGASIISNNNATQPLELPIEVIQVGERQYIPVSNTQSQLPMKMYCDFAFPLANCYFWPKPNVSNIQAVLYCPTALAQFTSLTADYVIPPGYLRAIRYNLAVELAAEWGLPLSDIISAKAAEFLADIRVSNIRGVVIGVDPALTRTRGGQFNYLTGEVM